MHFVFDWGMDDVVILCLPLRMPYALQAVLLLSLAVGDVRSNVTFVGCEILHIHRNPN